MKKLSQDDKKIWKAVTRTVTPKGEPAPPQEESVSFAAGMAQIFDFAAYVPPSDLKKKRSGRRVLDLHGMTQNEGHRAIDRMLCQAKMSTIAEVEIITGKGHGKGAGLGFFKRLVPLWLEVPPFSKMIKRWHWKKGNDGCLIAYIK
jgi:DNA-nicking Smr family endonuclease